MIKLSRIAGKIYRLVLSRATLLFMFLVLCGDIYLETVGLPEFAVDRIEKKISEKVSRCRLESVRMGFWNGIVIKGIESQGDTEYGKIDVYIPRAVVRLKYLPLLLFDITPGRIYVQNAEMELVESASGRRISLENVNCNADFDSDGRLDVVTRADWNGVALSLRGRIFNFHSFESFYNLALALPVEKGGQKKSEHSGNEQLAGKILDKFISSDFGFNDSLLEVSVEIDLNRPEQTSVSGVFSINDAFVSDILVSKLHGRFKYSEKVIDVKDILWIIGRNETVRGAMRYDFGAGTISGDAKAALIPDTVLNIFGMDHVFVGTYLDVRKPVAISLSVPEPVKPDKMEISAKCSLEDAVFMGFDIPECNATVSYGRGKVILRDLNLHFAGGASEYLRGRVDYDIREKTLSCDLDGIVSIGRRLDELNIEVNDNVRKILENPAKLSISLGKSRLDLQSLDAVCRVSMEDFDTAYWKIEKIEIPMFLKNGILSIGGEEFEISGMNGAAGNIEASVELKNGIENGVYFINHALSLKSTYGSNFQDCAAWNGSLEVNMAERMIECRGRGTCYIDRFYDVFWRKIDLDFNNFMEKFKCGAEPVSCDAVVKMPFDGGWTVDGVLRGEAGCGFDIMTGKSLISNFSVDEKRIEFTGLNAELTGGEKISLDMKFDFEPFAFEIRDMHLEGNPALAEVFIFSKKAKEVYSAVWSGFEWDEYNDPVVDISVIRYYSDDTGNTWGLHLDGGIAAENFKWKGESIAHGSAKIDMNLPERLDVPKAVIRLDGAEIAGSGNVVFEGIPHANFRVDRADGNINLRNLALAMNPDLKKVIPEFSLGPDTHIECSGFLNLQTPLRPEMSGKVKTDKLTVKNIVAENVDCEWKYVNSNVKINVIEAGLMGGSFSGGYSYDLNQQNGNFIAECKEVSVEEVLSVFSGEEKVSYPGKLSANCSLTYYLGWGSVKSRIDGMVNLSVIESDIWNVPVLKQLRTIVDFANFKLFRKNGDKSSNMGKITSADANIIFMGDRLVINDFKTDGTIVALEGRGSYLWNEDYIDVTVNSRILHKINILSLLFRPLSGAFDARLKGPRKSAEWNVRSYFSKMFSYEE